jgi:hypothetical protein
MPNFKIISVNISKISFNQMIPARFSPSFVKGGQICPVRFKKHVILSMLANIYIISTDLQEEVKHDIRRR